MGKDASRTLRIYRNVNSPSFAATTGLRRHFNAPLKIG
jgi:hypothetical protein